MESFLRVCLWFVVAFFALFFVLPALVAIFGIIAGV